MSLNKKSLLITARMAALRIAFWGLFIGLFARLYYDTIYMAYPSQPDPATLHTYPYAFKNTVRYLTKEQIETQHRLDYILIGFGIFLAINVIAHFIWPLPDKKLDKLRASKSYSLYLRRRPYLLKAFGAFLMIMSAIFIFCYAGSFYSSAFVHYPWWYIFFYLAIGMAGFFVRKFAAQQLQRQNERP